MKNRIGAVALATLCIFTAHAAVPLESFAKHQDYRDAEISPNGEYIAMKVPVGNGLTGLAVMSLSPMKIISKTSLGDNQNVHEYWWVSPNRLIITPSVEYGMLSQPALTGELIGTNADGTNQKYLYGFRGAGETGTLIKRVTSTLGFATILQTLDKDPEHAIIETSSFYDSTDNGVARVARLNVLSGFLDNQDSSPVAGPSDLSTDREGRLRFATETHNSIDKKTYFRAVPGGEWAPMNTGKLEHATIEPIGFSRDDTRVFFTADRSSDGNCLYEREIKSGADTALACVNEGSIGNIEWSFDGGEPIARRLFSDKPLRIPLDRKSEDQTKLLQLSSAFPGLIVEPVSHTTDGSTVVVYVHGDRDPGGYYLFHPRTMRADPLLALRDWIDPKQMAEQKVIYYKTRDGVTIQGFLTLPNGVPAKNLPLVTLPHGGPFGINDDWGWHADAQMLASRGYAVLQMNYRGSGGYGAAFMEAGRNGWDSTMINDITDGTRWAVAQGIADPQRLCIFGASYGGYAAVMSAVREPDLYKCAIGYAGVYDLPLLKRESDSTDSKVGLHFFNEFVGSTPERLSAASPINYLDRLKAKLMIVHGKDDTRVPFDQATTLRSALDARHYPYVWLAKSGEQHGFYDEKNIVELYDKLLKFLADSIGAGATAVPAKSSDTAPPQTSG